MTVRSPIPRPRTGLRAGWYDANRPHEPPPAAVFTRTRRLSPARRPSFGIPRRDHGRLSPAVTHVPPRHEPVGPRERGDAGRERGPPRDERPGVAGHLRPRTLPVPRGHGAPVGADAPLVAADRPPARQTLPDGAVPARRLHRAARGRGRAGAVTLPRVPHRGRERRRLLRGVRDPTPRRVILSGAICTSTGADRLAGPWEELADQPRGHGLPVIVDAEHDVVVVPPSRVVRSIRGLEA